MQKIRVVKPWMLGVGEDEQGRPRWYLRLCLHCGLECEEMYMVFDSLWESVTRGPEREGYLHFLCLESRLGRRLTVEDFTIAPINYFGAVEQHLGIKLGLGE